MPQQLFERMSTRKRRPNWTEEECLLLAQLMLERKEIIRGKSSSGVSIHNKRQAWEEIAQSINAAFPHMQRTVSDCNKKWENLLAKSREEIRRQKRHADSEELCIEHLSTVTQVVISVMNLSNMLQQDKDDFSASEMMQTQQNCSDDDGNDHMIDEPFTNTHPLTDLQLPSYPDESTSPPEQKMTFLPNIHKSFTTQFSTPRPASFTASAEQSEPPRSTSTPAAHCTTVQERMDLEISVLRRQEAVLKLQEEYYTLKIKLMKKQMEKQL